MRRAADQGRAGGSTAAGADTARAASGHAAWQGADECSHDGRRPSKGVMHAKGAAMRLRGRGRQGTRHTGGCAETKGGAGNKVSQRYCGRAGSGPVAQGQARVGQECGRTWVPRGREWQRMAVLAVNGPRTAPQRRAAGGAGGGCGLEAHEGRPVRCRVRVVVVASNGARGWWSRVAAGGGRAAKDRCASEDETGRSCTDGK